MKIMLMMLLVFGFCFGHEEYDRSEWKYSRYTRQKVLIEENLAPPESTQIVDGRIIKGKWVCRYTGDTITDPRELDVDHVVPLWEAWWSGGEDWYPSQKEAFSNHLDYEDHLVAVKSSANRRKGSKDPFAWMPRENQCWYLETWIRIKSTWGLEMDADESDFIFEYKDDYCGCGN